MHTGAGESAGAGDNGNTAANGVSGEALASEHHAGPSLLRHLNERAVFEALRSAGPLSRADITRRLGVSMPTVSKAMRNLLAARLVEELPDTDVPAGDTSVRRSGRPALLYTVARESVQVLGVSINVRHCSVAAAGLDGRIRPDSVEQFETPASYEKLMDAVTRRARKLVDRDGMRTLSIGVSVPGEVDHDAGRILLSPNLSITDNTFPSEELARRLGVETILVHETDATCLAEQAFGMAKGMSNIAILGVYEGFGASFVCDGRMLRGHNGLAGELGHITVVPDGRLCGCGNRGCLETEATDTAFARRVSERIGRRMEVESLVKAAAAGDLDVREELDQTLEFLAIGVASAINIFNPEAVLICSRMFDCDANAFGRLEHRVRRRALQPTVQHCKLMRAEGDTLVGAVAAALNHLTRSLGPKLR